MKKVSIVVPVYNAEKSVGKCLNSIFSQTFKDFEVIVVNDGSRDKSLEICKRYEKLDKRFRVFTKKNGGVSNARNFGVEKASGKYLTFIDSDDIVSLDYLEKMVAAAEKYKTGLVISDLVLIDFNKPETRIILTGANYKKGNPLVLSEKVLKERMMELIWKTSLLESMCGKLVDLKVWKKNKIKLDPKLSLGEDFLANLEYYKYCNGAVFLNEPLYYYDNVDGSSSLSHKYRKDLFEIKMYLAEKLSEYLRELKEISQKEKEYLINYTAAYGIVGLENAILSREYQSRSVYLKRIKEIISNERFIQAIKKSTYLKYPGWKKLILSGDSRKLASERSKIEQKSIDGGSWKNRFARRMVRICYCNILKNNKKGEVLDKKIASIGIRNTIKGIFK